LQFICEQLDKIGGQYIFSIPTNIARVLRQYLPVQDREEEGAEEDEELAPVVFEPELSIPKTMLPEELVQDTLPTGGVMKCPKCGERAYQPSGVACGTCIACGHVGCG
jgi:hypothetical protein